MHGTPERYAILRRAAQRAAKLAAGVALVGALAASVFDGVSVPAYVEREYVGHSCARLLVDACERGRRLDELRCGSTLRYRVDVSQAEPHSYEVTVSSRWLDETPSVRRVGCTAGVTGNVRLQSSER